MYRRQIPQRERGFPEAARGENWDSNRESILVIWGMLRGGKTGGKQVEKRGENRVNWSKIKRNFKIKKGEKWQEI